MFLYENNTTNHSSTCQASFIFQLNINDYIEVLGIKAGSTGNITTIANACWCLLELIREG